MHDNYRASGVGVYTYETVASTEMGINEYVSSIVEGTNPRAIMETADAATPQLEIGTDPALYESEVLNLRAVDESALDDNSKAIITEERALLTGKKLSHNGMQLAIPDESITFLTDGARLMTKTRIETEGDLAVTTYMTPLDPEQLSQAHPRDEEGIAGHNVRALLLEHGGQFVDLSKRADWHPLRGGTTAGTYNQHTKTVSIGIPQSMTDVVEALHEMHHGKADEDPFASLGNATEAHRKAGGFDGLSPEAGLLVGAEESYAWRAALTELASLRDRGFSGIDDALLQHLSGYAASRLATYKEGLPESEELAQAFSLEDLPQHEKDKSLISILGNSLQKTGLDKLGFEPAGLARELSWPAEMRTTEDRLTMMDDPDSPLAVNAQVIRDVSLILFNHSPKVSANILTEAERYIVTALSDPDPESYEQKRLQYAELLHGLTEETVFEEGASDTSERISAYFGF